MRSHACQVTLVTAGKVLVKQAGNCQAQHRITQEFKPLVVLDTIAAVSHRQSQQTGIDKLVAELALQSVEAGIHRGRSCLPRTLDRHQGERPSYLISRNTGLINSISFS